MTARVSRSTTIRVAGSSRTASINARTDSCGSSTGSNPILQQLFRKMSAKLGAITARNPKSSSAHGACSRLEPPPKLAPAIRIEAPA